MTCAKKNVECVIRTANGGQVTGSNWCRNPQSTCPRDPGEGYEKCTSICDQVGHAEIDAIQKAKERGINLNGARALVLGHSYACQHCQEALYAEGVQWIGVLE